MKKRLAARWLLGISVVGMMVVIFLFSAQNAAASTQVSNTVLQWVMDELRMLVRLLTGSEPEEHTLALIIRKIGHFSEFAMLCFLTRCFLHTYQLRKASLYAWLFSVGYAMTDELHQLFVPGRSGQVTDVMIDASGAAAGLCAACLLLLIIRRSKRRNQSRCT